MHGKLIFFRQLITGMVCYSVDVDWFDGLSQMFLDLKCKKLLLTTTKFRLDQVLMNGLKEDKFQLCIFEHSGHNIHEDEYEKVGRILIGSFIQ